MPCQICGKKMTLEEFIECATCQECKDMLIALDDIPDHE